MVEVKASGLPHVTLKQWLGVSKGVFSIEYFLSNKSGFLSLGLHGSHLTQKFYGNLAIFSFGDITGFETVVSVHD